MAQVVSVHSFRGGTGKSNTTANVATILAAEGRRVGQVDLDIQSPGIHVIFGFDQDGSMTRSLNDYLWGDCELRDAAHDVTPSSNDELAGRVWLVLRRAPGRRRAQGTAGQARPHRAGILSYPTVLSPTHNTACGIRHSGNVLQVSGLRPDSLAAEERCCGATVNLIVAYT